MSFWMFNVVFWFVITSLVMDFSIFFRFLSRTWLWAPRRRYRCITAVLFMLCPLLTSISSVSSPQCQRSASTFMRSVPLWSLSVTNSYWQLYWIQISDNKVYKPFCRWLKWDKKKVLTCYLRMSSLKTQSKTIYESSELFYLYIVQYYSARIH